MALDGGAYVPQPYYAFVQLYMNGQDLILTNNRPQHLISFTHTLETNATASWSVELFDATFNLLEHQIWEQSTAGRRPILKFKYGYTGGVESPYYYSELAQVTPTWSYSGVTLRLEGTHVPGENQNIPTIWYKRDRAFVDMKISEIVEKLCTENGYVIDRAYFDETEPILLPQDLNSTNPINKIFEQKGMSMEQFIKHFLLPYAVKAGTKQGGYVFYIDHRTEPAKVRFYVPDKGPGMECPGVAAKRKYTIRQNKMEEWVDFTYDLGYGPKEATGIFEEAHFSIDPTTGEYVFEKYNVENQKKFLRLYGHAYRKPQFTDEMNNVRMRPSHAPAILEDERKFFHRNHLIRKLRGKAMKATLTIVGDPRDDVFPGDFITIENILPDGTPHYSSGCYIINKITHQISGGTYTTTFDISRNAAPKSPEARDSSEHPINNTSQVGGGGY